MPTAISYTTADEGAQYSSYYARPGPGSAPAAGPLPQLGVPTAISYTDVGLGFYSGKCHSNAVYLPTILDFAGSPQHAEEILRAIIVDFSGKHFSMSPKQGSFCLRKI